MARRCGIYAAHIRWLAGVPRRGLINHWAYGENAEIEAFAHAAWLAGAEAERKRIADTLADGFAPSQDQLGVTVKTTIDMDTQEARSEQM